ncbi:unnamed protein product, partial [Mesorhabditis belari]|uniref:Calpain catalytic domain-containing protein n=1 Tax=Mesorhabditis belari TaxID=2138241 RepID=A0AAF3EA08_9BILA
MSKDGPQAAAMQTAQRAIEFDHAQRYEEAIYFYAEATRKILELLGQKKILPILRKNAQEYVERAEFLKKELPRLQAERASKLPPQQLLYEQAEFTMMKAVDIDERGESVHAMSLYKEAIQMCLNMSRSNGIEDSLKEKLRKVAGEALERAEHLQFAVDSKLQKENDEAQRLSLLLPAALSSELVLSEMHLDDRAPSGRGTPSGGPSPTPNRKNDEGLSKEELAVLAVTSRINGRSYVPFLSQDLREQFHFTLPFTDKHGKLALTEKQVKRLKGWARASEIIKEPTVIKRIDSGTIKQTVISDCSFVASLAIAARYERRFGKQLVTSVIYPQDRRKQPIYNESGKYMVKLHINGVWRKVIIDDCFPIGENNQLLCSYSQQEELWVSLLEKAYMKVMGGYDFPGSNSNIDLHALTGWIPERVPIKKDSKEFDPDKLFEKLLQRFHQGDCLITLATGKLDEATCSRAGLVDSHAYAVLDLRKFQGKRLLMVKNPWTHLRWKGRFSENDETSWTPELCKALDFDPSKAKERDDGVFWIDYESVMSFFDVFYVNWNPGLFPYTYGLHSQWNACAGPIKDLFSVASNPQYSLEVRNKGPAPVWILLTRHITEIADFANNKEFITVMVYEGGKKVYIPFDPKPLYDGVRINSPHYLCQMLLTEPGPKRFTLVVAQYEKSTTIFYTLRVYSTAEFTLAPIKLPYKFKKTETGKWEGKTAGGCGNGTSRETVENNPIFHISTENHSDENMLFLELKGPKQYSIGFDLWAVSTAREYKEFNRISSGAYRPGYTVLTVERLPAGVFAVRPATFLSNQEGPFILTIEASCNFSIKRIQ